MIFFDMDGVLARWETCPVEKTHEPGHFLHKEEEPAIHEAIDILIDSGYKVGILGCVYRDGTAKSDKTAWLLNRGLGHVPRHFVPYGDDKFRYVPKGCHLLVDDYSANLHAWEAAGMRGIKFLNGINGTHGTWHGQTVSHRMSGREIADTIIQALRKA